MLFGHWLTLGVFSKMDYAGEGNHVAYLGVQHTGYTAFASSVGKDYLSRAPYLTRMCQEVSVHFSRYEKRTSSPTDTSSWVIGMHNSPVSQQISLTVARQNEHGWPVVGYESMENWDIPATVDNPMALQFAFFAEMVSHMSFWLFLDPDAPGGKSETMKVQPAIAVHLEVDLFTFRSVLMFAEHYGLRVRFFPTPFHPALDGPRTNAEFIRLDERRKGRDNVHGDTFAVKGAIALKYGVIAFCPSCAKHLEPDQAKRCEQCKIAYYCSEECQKKDWAKLHEAECAKFTKLIAESQCGFC